MTVNLHVYTTSAGEVATSVFVSTLSIDEAKKSINSGKGKIAEFYLAEGIDLHMATRMAEHFKEVFIQADEARATVFHNTFLRKRHPT